MTLRKLFSRHCAQVPNVSKLLQAIIANLYMFFFEHSTYATYLLHMSLIAPGLILPPKFLVKYYTFVNFLASSSLINCVSLFIATPVAVLKQLLLSTCKRILQNLFPRVLRQVKNNSVVRIGAGSKAIENSFKYMYPKQKLCPYSCLLMTLRAASTNQATAQYMVLTLETTHLIFLCPHPYRRKTDGKVWSL